MIRKCLCALLVLLGSTATSQAAVMVFSDRTAFEAATPGLPLEDFEDLTVAAGSIATISEPAGIDEFTNNAVVSPGDIVSGVNFRSLDANLDLVAAGAGHQGAASKILGLASLNQNMGISFDPDVNAFGADLLVRNSDDRNRNWQIRVYGETTNLLLDTTITIDSPATSAFFGILADEPLTEVLLGRAGDTLNLPRNVAIDNVSFGQLVPEPASFMLVAIGALALAGCVRRQA